MFGFFFVLTLAEVVEKKSLLLYSLNKIKFRRLDQVRVLSKLEDFHLGFWFGKVDLFSLVV